MKSIILGAFASGILLAGAAAPAEAQCRLDCDTCVIFANKAIGEGPAQDGVYYEDEGCVWAAWCKICPLPEEEEQQASAAAIFEELRDNPTGQLRTVVARYGDRLSIDLARGLLVIQDRGCGTRDLVSVALLNHREKAVLADAGVRRLGVLGESAVADEDGSW